MKKILTSLILVLIITSCAAPTQVATQELVLPTSRPTSTQTQVVQSGLWVSDTVPANLRAVAKGLEIPMVFDQSLSSATLDVSNSGSQWIYALVAPFPTVTDEVSSAELISLWQTGVSTEPLTGHRLIMAESTLQAFSALWGEPASSVVRAVLSDNLLDTAWADMSNWAIIPFEEIQPKWKVLSVDGQSPIHKNFEAEVYPLKVYFALSNSDIVLPKSNRDPSKLATVVLTGVTALVRATAFTMETKGVTRPGELIHDWLYDADVTHISNEVAFDPACPFPTPGYKNFILCSDPKYFNLLKYVGTDLVELTGDHFTDRGTKAMLDTLQMYRDNNIPYYGGGANEKEARQPVLMEVNGNKLAFIGCNGKVSYKFVKATEYSPGAADCGDYEYFTKEVNALAAEGYMVIFTFQHEECYHSGPCYMHEKGFHAVADAGATVVSGSQAHFPHLMEFRGDSFIHFGLGNLFFDQMTYTLPDGSVIDGTRREFIDRHVFYDGKYLGVELLTAMLEDFSRPRPMNERERTAFLSEYFYHSGWIPLEQTPFPLPTPTLTPIAIP